MARRSTDGKREQERRTAATIKSLVGDTEAELARFRGELDQLIESGQVARVLRVRDMSEDLFAMWQGVQDLKDSTAAFVACCREYYDRKKREMPEVIALREQLTGQQDYPETRRLMRQFREMEERDGEDTFAALRRQLMALGEPTPLDRSRIDRLMRRLKATLGELPAGKAKAVRRVLNEELKRDAS